MKQLETAYVRECFQALASRQIQVLDPRMWAKASPPVWLRASDPAIKGVCWRANTGGARGAIYGLRGDPDIQGMFRGGLRFGLEVKTPIGKESAYQEWNREFFAGLGMLRAVVRGFEDTIRILASWGY